MRQAGCKEQTMGSRNVSTQNIKGPLRNAKIKEKQIKLKKKRIYKSPVVKSHGVTNPSLIINPVALQPYRALADRAAAAGQRS